MTIPVFLCDLDAAVRQRGGVAYVLTVGDGGSPHVVQADVASDAGRLVATVGARTASNARSRPSVTVLYPSRHIADYTLIVDAVATVVSTPTEAQLLLAPTRAVLHHTGPDRVAMRVGLCADCSLGRAMSSARGGAGTDRCPGIRPARTGGSGPTRTIVPRRLG